jgi:hypothetical protein
MCGENAPLPAPSVYLEGSTLMMRSSVGTVALLFLCLLLFGGQCGAVDRSQVAATPPPTHTNLGQAGTPSPTLIPEPTVTALSLSHPIAVVGEGEVAGNRDIFLIHADETQTVKQLTNRPWDDFSPSWLTWSPDGTRLAFASSQEDTPTNIYVIDADGSNLVQITQNGAVRSAWSLSPCRGTRARRHRAS